MELDKNNEDIKKMLQSIIENQKEIIKDIKELKAEQEKLSNGIKNNNSAMNALLSRIEVLH